MILVRFVCCRGVDFAGMCWDVLGGLKNLSFSVDTLLLSIEKFLSCKLMIDYELGRGWTLSRQLSENVKRWCKLLLLCFVD